jgi:hypothetical protein
MRSRRLLVVALALALWPRAVDAHKLVVQRTLYIEPSGARDLQIVLKLHVPNGDSRKSVEVMADADHDGHVNEGEMKALRRTLALRALDGLKLVAGTTTLAVDNVETKIRFDRQDGPVDLMLHAVARLPSEEALAIDVSTSPGADELELIVLAGTRPALATDRGSVDRGGFHAKLGQGDRVTWRIDRRRPAKG